MRAGMPVFDADPSLLGQRPGQTLIGGKNYYGRDFEAILADAPINVED